MRHLTIADYGQFVGVTGERLVVRDDTSIILETPLSRLRSVAIARDGVSFSSNLVTACAARGIRLFFLDWKGLAVAAVTGRHQHAIANVRRQQFLFQTEPESRAVAAGMIFGKIRNQRAVLLYFAKYHKQHAASVKQVAESMSELARRLKDTDWRTRDVWRAEIMGIEGAAAAAYWKHMKVSGWLGETFTEREGRGATTLSNKLLNYGYTLLTSYIWAALDNAGFELYSGFLHQERAGKPALVLDMMEEYRAWVVDRQIIAMRSAVEAEKDITPKLKRRLSKAIQECIATRYPYHGKRLRLDTIMQRQAYRLAASVMGEKRYQPYRFKW
jgi:CRISPR-associated protein Cas1